MLLQLLLKLEWRPLLRLRKVVTPLQPRLRRHLQPPSLLHDLSWPCVGMTALA